MRKNDSLRHKGTVKAGIILYNNTTGVTINDIYTKPLNNAHFYDNNKTMACAIGGTTGLASFR